MADFIERQWTSVTLAPSRFSIFFPSGPACSVGQYDKSVGNKTPTRPRCRFSFLAFSPVLCPCSSFSSRAARLAPPPFHPVSPLLFSSPSLPHSLSVSLFFTKLPLVCAYASSLYGSRPLVQQRIINYSPLR